MTGPALRYPFNALVSFHYYRKFNIASLAAVGLRLIADSGAYSARTTGADISLDEFAEWAHQWRDSLVWVASLDVIHQPEVTWKNYRYLRDKKALDVVPTLHAGDDVKWLDRYAKDGVDFIGLGGLVPHRGRPQATLPWLVHFMRHARDHHPGMRFHGWGVTNPVMTKTLPWYSVDSSNLGQSYRYGRLVVFDPSTGRWAQIAMDGKAALAHDDLLRRWYGVRGRDVAASTAETRRLLVRVTGRSYQLAEDYLRARHGNVTAPTYGICEPAPAALGLPKARRPRRGAAGPNVHGALDTKRRAEDVAAELGRAGPHVHGTDGRPEHLAHLGDDL